MQFVKAVPPELLRYILSYLTDNDVVSFLLVSKEFKNKIDGDAEFWKQRLREVTDLNGIEVKKEYASICSNLTTPSEAHLWKKAYVTYLQHHVTYRPHNMPKESIDTLLARNYGERPEIKLVVIGGAAVGKSALTLRFVTNKFISDSDPTIEDSYRKQHSFRDTVILFDILDTACQEEYSAMRDRYVRTGEVFALVYDVTNFNSFDETYTLREQVLRVKDRDESPMVLVGNKIDDASNRVVTTEMGREKAEKWRIPFIETSAKLDRNVTAVFEEAAIELARFQQIHQPKIRKKTPYRKRCSMM